MVHTWRKWNLILNDWDYTEAIDSSRTEVQSLIKSLNLTTEQMEIMKKVLDLSFSDIFYTILLGLDGSASIGGVQELYMLKDEYGNQLTGEIEGHAYDYFQER